MSNNAIRIPVSTLQSFICDTFTKLGVPEDEAQVCSEVVITSDLRGIESHGIGRLKYYYDRINSGQHKAITQVEVVRESPTTAVVDGHHGMGMIIGTRSMQMAIDKAEKYRHGRCGGAQFYPFWHRRLLPDHGSQRRNDGHDFHQCAPIDRPDLWRAAQVGHESHRVRLSDRRAISVPL